MPMNVTYRGENSAILKPQPSIPRPCRRLIVSSSENAMTARTLSGGRSVGYNGHDIPQITDPTSTALLRGPMPWRNDEGI